MPRYFFNLLHHDGEIVPDDEGLELEDDADAKREAMEKLHYLLEESLTNDLKPTRVSVEIVREGGGMIGRVAIDVHT
jgi:hypothetical protein